MHSRFTTTLKNLYVESPSAAIQMDHNFIKSEPRLCQRIPSFVDALFSAEKQLTPMKTAWPFALFNPFDFLIASNHFNDVACELFVGFCIDSYAREMVCPSYHGGAISFTVGNAPHNSFRPERFARWAREYRSRWNPNNCNASLAQVLPVANSVTRLEIECRTVFRSSGKRTPPEV